ncbi:hypothetical protein ACFU7Y_42000 [Kitasatospora sp. NPDC057542]|uniref:hypothetical protein n=1 Tax=Kitasatospora sp. NPDC057542 TaxID=3346162 RepID=UPI0036C813B6
MTVFDDHVRSLLTKEGVASIGRALIAFEEGIQQTAPLEEMRVEDDEQAPIKLMTICRPDNAFRYFPGVEPGESPTAFVDLVLPGRFPSGSSTFPADMTAYARSLAHDARTPRLDVLGVPEGPTVGVLIVVGRWAFDLDGSRRQRALFAVLADGTTFGIARTHGEPTPGRFSKHIATSSHDLMSALWLVGRALHVFPAHTPPPSAFQR